MMFALVVTSAICMALALRRWQSTEITAARWALYALRDELRWKAATSPERMPRAFVVLDQSITGFCAMCQREQLSLWTFAGTSLIPDGSLAGPEVERRAREELKLNGYPELQEIHETAIRFVIRMLFWRHLFLTLILVPTVVGGFGLYLAFKRVATLALANIGRRSRAVAA